MVHHRHIRHFLIIFGFPMKIFLLLIIFAIASLGTYGQNTIGLPEIINYSKQRYAAGTQNWDIKKDKNGIVYFANNEGLLSFDGTYWKLQALPNKSIVRSVEIGNDGRIYVGGQEELGFFYPDKKGSLVYTSLKPLIPKDESSFADVWDVIIFENQVFFRSNRKIFQYEHNQVTVFKSIDWRFMGLSNGQLIAQEYERGLLTFQNGVWSPFLKKSSLPADYRVSTIISISKDSSLLATQNKIYLLSKDIITPFQSGAIPGIAANKVYASAKLDEDRIALATNLGGCYIVDKKGNLIQRLAKQDGIQLNNILSVYADKEKNLWLGLDNGIDFINYGSALKKIAPDPMNKYSGYACIIYNNELYLGTSAGAFKAKLYESNDLSFVKSNFEEIKNSKGQVWNFSNVNGRLLMGHNDGAFLIKDNVAVPLDPSSGFWTFQPLNNVLPSSRMIAGTYNGINVYDYYGGNFNKSKVHAHFESARFVVNDNGVLWIAHPYKGLYVVRFDSTGFPKASVYEDKKGILSANNNYLFSIHNKTILCTEKGIFELDAGKKDFIRSSYYSSLFGNQTLSYLTEDHYGNIWFVAGKRIGIIEETDTKPEIHYFTKFYGQTPEGLPIPSYISLDRMIEIISTLPTGLTVITCHPGYADDLKTMYQTERRDELRVLCDPRVRAAIDTLGINLCSFNNWDDLKNSLNRPSADLVS